MKRFIIVLLATAFTLVGCASTSGSKLVPTATTENTPTVESNLCVNHNFSEATFISPRTCEICEMTEGEPLSAQCKTWEEVVTLAGFEGYAYDLQVFDSEEHVILILTFDDASLFATEEVANNFMLECFLAFMSISWFSRDRLLVTTPEVFQVDTSIRLNFPDGAITCMPIGSPYGMGYSTMLSCEEDSPNKYLVQKAYNQIFESVDIG